MLEFAVEASLQFEEFIPEIVACRISFDVGYRLLIQQDQFFGHGSAFSIGSVGREREIPFQVIGSPAI